MIYFISDAHLGSRLVKNPREHELKLVNWLCSIEHNAKAIYMLGDMFDFWYEYKTVVPRGYVRFLGKLAEMTDKGIEIHFFIGNHDIWTFGYLEQEVGLIVHKKAEVIDIAGKQFYLAHGDGLYVKNKSFKLLRSIFHSKFAQALFRLVPPELGQGFGFWWSMKNRLKIAHLENKYQGEHREVLVKFAKEYIETNPVDYLLFGHRHIALDLQLKNQKRVLILGDFVSIYSYAVFDGQNIWMEYLPE